MAMNGSFSIVYGKLRKTGERKARLAIKTQALREAEELEAKGFVITQVLRPGDQLAPVRIDRKTGAWKYMDEEQATFLTETVTEVQQLQHELEQQYPLPMQPWEATAVAKYNKARIEKHFKMLKDL